MSMSNLEPHSLILYQNWKSHNDAIFVFHKSVCLLVCVRLRALFGGFKTTNICTYNIMKGINAAKVA